MGLFLDRRWQNIVPALKGLRDKRNSSCCFLFYYINIVPTETWKQGPWRLLLVSCCRLFGVVALAQVWPQKESCLDTSELCSQDWAWSWGAECLFSQGMTHLGWSIVTHIYLANWFPEKLRISGSSSLSAFLGIFGIQERISGHTYINTFY